MCIYAQQVAVQGHVGADVFTLTMNEKTCIHCLSRHVLQVPSTENETLQ